MESQLSIFQGPTRPLTSTLVNNLFENTAAGVTKNNMALIFEDINKTIELTYAEVDKISNTLAKRIGKEIQTKKLKPNSDGDYIVAVNMHPSDELVVVLLAIWKAGAAYLPLDHSFPESRIQHILQEAQPVFVICDDESKNFFATPKFLCKELKRSSKNQSEESLREAEKVYHEKDDIAIVLYTSGSTGVPKGVRISHKAILNRLQWQFVTFPYSETEKYCVFKTTLSFLDSVAEIWGPLINGLVLVIIPKNIILDPERLIENLNYYGVERLVLVPSLLRSLLMCLQLKKKENLLKSLKLWVCSGEILPSSLVAEFFKYFSGNEYKLCNFYGSTEVMADVTYHVISSLDQLKSKFAVPIGLPVDNTIVYLLDPDLRPVKIGEIGEIFVSGLNLASGYVNNRDKNKFLNNHLAADEAFSILYQTGDFGRVEKGILLYEGRIDSQVKIRGHRVDLSEVEKVINSVPGVEKAVALCYRPGKIDQTLLAFVQNSSLMKENQIENLLKTKLASHMVPQVILVKNIPLLVNGKLDRQTLLKSYENINNSNDDTYKVEIDYEGVPQDLMKPAKVLFDVMAEVLNKSVRSKICLKSNFFEIGGNSLNSIYTITKLNKKGFHISVGDFLSAATLREVLLFMTSSENIQTQSPNFTFESLKNEHKSEVIDIMVTSLYEKSELNKLLRSVIQKLDYIDYMEAIWDSILEKNLSFVVKCNLEKIIGVNLNFDILEEPDVPTTLKINVFSNIIDSIENPEREKFFPISKGQILYSHLMATHLSLSPKENVAVIHFMENEVLKLAKTRKFKGIFTTNINPLTQQLGTDVYHYQTLLDYQLNQYVAEDQSKPFALAPDSLRAIVHWKPILN